MEMSLLKYACRVVNGAWLIPKVPELPTFSWAERQNGIDKKKTKTAILITRVEGLKDFALKSRRIENGYLTLASQSRYVSQIVNSQVIQKSKSLD